MKMKYKFVKEDVLNTGRPDFLVIVDKPYHLLSFMIEGDESIEEIEEMIENLQKVQNDEQEEYWFGNQTGFLGVAIMTDKNDPENWPKGVYVFDQFDENPITHKFRVDIEEVIKLLEDFKKFVEENS